MWSLADTEIETAAEIVLSSSEEAVMAQRSLSCRRQGPSGIFLLLL